MESHLRYKVDGNIFVGSLLIQSNVALAVSRCSMAVSVSYQGLSTVKHGIVRSCVALPSRTENTRAASRRVRMAVTENRLAVGPLLMSIIWLHVE